jgi:hypothetical protein
MDDMNRMPNTDMAKFTLLFRFFRTLILLFDSHNDPCKSVICTLWAEHVFSDSLKCSSKAVTLLSSFSSVSDLDSRPPSPSAISVRAQNKALLEIILLPPSSHLSIVYSIYIYIKIFQVSLKDESRAHKIDFKVGMPTVLPIES